MARWRDRPQEPVIPERLCRYVAAEWPGGVEEWYRACWAWLDAHPGRRLPFGDDGDHLDVLREVVRMADAGQAGPGKRREP